MEINKSKEVVIAEGEIAVEEDDEGIDVSIGRESLCMDIADKLIKKVGKKVQLVIREINNGKQ